MTTEEEIILPDNLYQKLLLKSTGAFFLAFLPLYYISMMSGVLGGLLVGISATMRFYGLDFLIEAKKWDRLSKVMYAYGFPWAFLFLMMILSYGVYVLFVRYRNSQLSWWLSWLATLSFSMSCATVIAGVIAQKNTYFAILFLNYYIDIKDQLWITAYLVPSVIGLVLSAVVCRRQFLELMPSIDMLIQGGNRKALVFLLFLPMLIGLSLWALILGRDFSYYHMIFVLSLVVAYAIATISSIGIRTVLIRKYQADKGSRIVLILGLLALFVTWFWLRDGATFIATSSY
jgi:hypothetical protein